MTDRENKALYIAEECRKAGITLAGTAGILASIEAESLFSPTNVEDQYERRVGNDAAYTAKVDNGSYQNFTGDAAGYGLAQWTAGDRKAGLLRFARQRGTSIGDFKMQVDYLLQEMRNYQKAWNTVTSSNNPSECGYAVCRYYEIPANTENESLRRGARAEYWYAWLTHHAGEESTIQPETGSETENAGSAEAPSATTPEEWKPRTIDTRCSGWPEVWLLQALLKCRGYNTLSDGIFGESLRRKVLDFQQAEGLQPDGIVGPKTWRKLGIKM